jgi:hypothetical protein
MTPLILLLVLTSISNASEFWNNILPLACKSSCERYFRTLDEPDKDCDAFCVPIVKLLSEDDNIQKALALSSGAYGLNLMQWSIRDVVMAVAERQPIEAMALIFITRLEFYEAELENSQNPEVRRTADKVRRAQMSEKLANQPGMPKPPKPPVKDMPNEDSAFIETEL